MKPERFEMLWQGLVTGLVGYVSVALVFAIWNVLTGQSPFYTAALLGGAVFYGVQDTASIAIWPGPVLAFNGLHLLVFLAVGLFMAWLATFAERGPHFWYIGAIVMLLVAFHMFAAVFWLPAPLREVMLGWSTVVAGAIAAAAMATYLVWAHPKLREEFRDFAAQDPDLADANR